MMTKLFQALEKVCLVCSHKKIKLMMGKTHRLTAYNERYSSFKKHLLSYSDEMEYIIDKM